MRVTIALIHRVSGYSNERPRREIAVVSMVLVRIRVSVRETQYTGRASRGGRQIGVDMVRSPSLSRADAGHWGADNWVEGPERFREATTRKMRLELRTVPGWALLVLGTRSWILITFFVLPKRS